MESTYLLQRADIDSGIMNVKGFKEAWPFLFQPFGLFQHFRRLVYVDIESALNDSLPKKKSSKDNDVYAIQETGEETTYCALRACGPSQTFPSRHDACNPASSDILW